MMSVGVIVVFDPTMNESIEELKKFMIINKNSII